MGVLVALLTVSQAIVTAAEAVSICATLQNLTPQIEAAVTLKGRALVVGHDVVLADLGCDVAGVAAGWPSGVLISPNRGIEDMTSVLAEAKVTIQSCGKFAEPVGVAKGILKAAAFYRLDQGSRYSGSGYGQGGVLPAFLSASTFTVSCESVPVVELCQLFDNPTTFARRTIIIRGRYWEDEGSHQQPILSGTCSNSFRTRWARFPRILGVETGTTLREPYSFPEESIRGILTPDDETAIWDSLWLSKKPGRKVLQGLFKGNIAFVDFDRRPPHCGDVDHGIADLLYAGVIYLEGVIEGETVSVADSDANDFWELQMKQFECVASKQ